MDKIKKIGLYVAGVPILLIISSRRKLIVLLLYNGIFKDRSETKIFKDLG
jgi:hypothetical protein